MIYTERYMAALDSLDRFVQRHRPELEAYLDALGRAEREAKAQMQALRNTFEDATGVTRTITTAEAEGDPAPAPIIASAGLMEDLDQTERRISTECNNAFEAIRMSERFERIINMRDDLIHEKNAARTECVEASDHPLIAARKQPKEAWVLSLDEKNFDLSTADTLERRAEIEENRRQLAAWEENERREDAARAEDLERRLREQRERGLLV